MESPCGLGAGSAAIALAFLSAGSTAGAAQQGRLGATSGGSISISASIAPRVQISGPQDIDFARTDPVTGAREAQEICMWSNAPGGSYTLTAVGSGPGGVFELSSGQRTVGYSVEWSTSAAQSSGAPPMGDTRTSLQAAATSADCAAGPGSANLVVALSPAQFRSAESGVAYTGALTLIVSPQ